MSEYKNYKKFSDKKDANPITELLLEQEIPFHLVESTAPDSIQLTRKSDQEFWIQLLTDDFEKVDKLIEKKLLNKETTTNHYLNEFSDSELIEIIEKFDEWSESDIHFAKKLLKERGKEISESQTKELRQKRIEELEKPERVKFGWIIAGYVIALLGGFISIIIGLSISNVKKTLPDGRKVYSYDRKSRLHAKNILVLGIMIMIASLIYTFLTN